MPVDIHHEALAIPAGDVVLDGDLALPAEADGLVVFAHGSGSSRHSPRNQYVAHLLQEGSLGTLLFDLLTQAEEDVDRRTGHLRFDIPLLAGRLVAVTDWLHASGRIDSLKCGYFGASTGAAAALIAAASRQGSVHAVVSRGGRPDLAASELPHVEAPTLLIVGGLDYAVIDMNATAFARLQCAKRMEIVRGATHLFEEPGTLDEVARLAKLWFRKFLGSETTR